MMLPRARRAGAFSTTQQPLLPRATQSRPRIWFRPDRETSQLEERSTPYGIDYRLDGSLINADNRPHLLPSRHEVMSQHRQLANKACAVAVGTGPLCPNGCSIG